MFVSRIIEQTSSAFNVSKAYFLQATAASVGVAQHTRVRRATRGRASAATAAAMAAMEPLVLTVLLARMEPEEPGREPRPGSSGRAPATCTVAAEPEAATTDSSFPAMAAMAAAETAPTALGREMREIHLRPKPPQTERPTRAAAELAGYGPVCPRPTADRALRLSGTREATPSPLPSSPRT